jgi:hypothetical protein
MPQPRPLLQGNELVNSVARNILRGAQRVPGQIVGGGTDLANLLLGVVSGKGLEGADSSPIGGSKSINNLFGLETPSSGVVQDSVEAVGGLLSPAGAAKGTALALGGMIVPSRAAISAIQQVLATNMKAAGKTAKEIYDATGAFWGKHDGKIMKGIIPDNDAKFIFGGNLAKDATSGAVRIADTGKLSDILDHPKLLQQLKNDPQLADLADIEVRALVNSRSSASYDPSANGGKGLIKVAEHSSESDFMSSFLHELQHAVQYRTGMTGGQNPANFIEYGGRLDRAKKNISQQLADLDAKYPGGAGADASIFALNKQLTMDREAVINVDRKAYARYRQTQGEAEAKVTEEMWNDSRKIKSFDPDIQDGFTRDMIKTDALTVTPKFDMDPSVKAIIDRYQTP